MKDRHSVTTLAALAFTPVLAFAIGCDGSATTTESCRAPLVVGDLVITEVMANPDGTDEGREWFEVYNNTGKELDLTRLRLVASKPDGTGEKLHIVGGAKIPARGWFVFGGMVEAAKPRYVDYAYGLELGGLGNAGGVLALRCGDRVIDKMLYTTAADGKSKELSGELPPDPVSNDNVDNWCDATTEFEPNGLGTPGAPNDTCGGAVTPGTCKESGTTRAVVAPGPGELVITEVMPNPAAGADEAKAEWFELVATRKVDLNGLQIATASDPMALKAIPDLSKLDCITVEPGRAVLLVRSKEAALNGGLPSVPPTFVFNNALVNSSGALSVGAQGVVVDTITWATTSDGVSWALDPGRVDAAKNDDAKNWCKGATTYGAGGKGTPGTANESCGIVEPGECLEGGVPRAKVEPAAGDLTLSEVMADPAGDETKKEWFEIKVARDVDLNGVQFGADLTKAKVAEGPCVRVTAGSHVVFGRSADPTLNGGIQGVAPWAVFTFGLVNSSGTLMIGYKDQKLDEHTWKTATPGKSASRDATSGAWCPATSAYDGGANLGTPGAPNDTCP